MCCRGVGGTNPKRFMKRLVLNNFKLQFEYLVMSTEMWSENSDAAGGSPRISFSYDLSHADAVPVEHLLRSTSSTSVDFDFCVFRFEHEFSPADELFENGKILPTQIKQNISRSLTPRTEEPPLIKLFPNPPPKPPPSQRQSPDDAICGPGMKTEAAESEEKQNSKSFWSFKRSRSLNCGSGYARTLCPLPLLTRSYSTGSAQPSTGGKRSSLLTDRNNSSNCKQNINRPPFSSNPASIRRSQSSSFNGSHQKPPLSKNYGSHGTTAGAGGAANALINIPSFKVFGFGSVFSANKDKNRKK